MSTRLCHICKGKDFRLENDGRIFCKECKTPVSAPYFSETEYEELWCCIKDRKIELEKTREQFTKIDATYEAGLIGPRIQNLEALLDKVRECKGRPTKGLQGGKGRRRALTVLTDELSREESSDTPTDDDSNEELPEAEEVLEAL